MSRLLLFCSFALIVVVACVRQPAGPRAPEGAGPSAQPQAAVAAEAPAGAYLEITLRVAPANRAAAAGVYAKYRLPFLRSVPGAVSKQLLVRDEDVVVLHGFDTTAHAAAYLAGALFKEDVVRELAPLLDAPPDIRIYAQP